jgi:S-adenosylmethionine decarboxylase
MTRLGHHYIAELWGCSSAILDDAARLESYFHSAAQTAQVTVLNSQFHEFEPQGVTGILLLSESHLSFHTWPEHGYCALDLFTCGNPHSARDAVLELANRLAANRVELQTIGRGHVHPIAGNDVETVRLYPPFQWVSAEVAQQEEIPFRSHVPGK